MPVHRGLRLLSLGRFFTLRAALRLGLDSANRLDAGGIRGLSELILLKEMMERLKDHKKLDSVPRPCEVFDMIAGSGTGGYVHRRILKIHFLQTDKDNYISRAKD